MRVLDALPLVAGCAFLALGCGDDDLNSPTLETSFAKLAKLLPDHADLRARLRQVLEEPNGGLGFEMWATILDRDGVVVDVVFSGEQRADQWPGSRAHLRAEGQHRQRVQPGRVALSTANLFAAVQPGGSLFGLQESNPVDTRVA